MTDHRWVTVKVQLVSGPTDLDHPPGRILLVGPTHTFADLADAIDTAFARWDLAHSHEFQLPDGRLVGTPDDDLEDFGLDPVLDDTAMAVTDHLHAGDTFSYTFDRGDDWVHQCSVDNPDADPSDAHGPLPTRPVPIWGWGNIPDQYGRLTYDHLSR